MGGPSSEHSVSLASGKMVLENMPERYEAVAVRLPKRGDFNLRSKLPKGMDLAFLALHGEWGEDGQVQKLLEKMKVPYTGSDSKASALAMNKSETLVLLKKKKIFAAPGVIIRKNGKMPPFGLPCVVKPNKRGSSVGVAIVRKKEAFNSAIRDAFKFDDEVMIEKFIPGTELTCGVLDDGRGKAAAFMPTEIIAKKGDFFDYNSKYLAGGAQELTPARLDKKTLQKVRQTALKVHKAMGASGVSRTDMILARDGKIYVLEINTIPGMTETSLLPKGAAACGLNFPQLLDKIVKAALNRFNRPK